MCNCGKITMRNVTQDTSAEWETRLTLKQQVSLGTPKAVDPTKNFQSLVRTLIIKGACQSIKYFFRIPMEINLNPL